MKDLFQQTKSFILNNSDHAVESIVDITEPFVMDYVKHPRGYAETDNVTDIDALMEDINDSFMQFTWETDGRIRKGMINRTIKTEATRWKEGKNAWFFGRHIGRLAYLLSKQN